MHVFITALPTSFAIPLPPYSFRILSPFFSLFQSSFAIHLFLHLTLLTLFFPLVFAYFLLLFSVFVLSFPQLRFFPSLLIALFLTHSSLSVFPYYPLFSSSSSSPVFVINANNFFLDSLSMKRKILFSSSKTIPSLRVVDITNYVD
jgi:hypothetical protein